MDRDFILELFSEFGPVTLRRMFSGYGVVADGVNFAMVLRGGMIFRVDEQTISKYDSEGAKPFQYDTKTKTVIVKSYRHLPERLYDDPDELAVWAREAVGAARRASAKKPKKTKPLKAFDKRPGPRSPSLKAKRKTAAPAKVKSRAVTTRQSISKKRQAT